MARLEEICAINMGQSPDSSTYNEDGNGLPFFQGNADGDWQKSMERTVFRSRRMERFCFTGYFQIKII